MIGRLRFKGIIRSSWDGRLWAAAPTAYIWFFAFAGRRKRIGGTGRPVSGPYGKLMRLNKTFRLLHRPPNRRTGRRPRRPISQFISGPSNNAQMSCRVGRPRPTASRYSAYAPKKVCGIHRILNHSPQTFVANTFFGDGAFFQGDTNPPGRVAVPGDPSFNLHPGLRSMRKCPVRAAHLGGPLFIHHIPL